MSQRGTRFTVTVEEGYSKSELIEGDSLEDLWLKLGEKIGKGQLVAAD